MRSFLHRLAEFLLRYDPRTLAAVGCGALVIFFLLVLTARRRRPSPGELERRRRTQIAATGRITDGYLTDAGALHGSTDDLPAHPDGSAPTPQVLFYSYKLAGVTYNCAQDVSTLAERIRGLQLDQPIQVRYDARNPGNSIVVAEEWSGLRVARAK